MVFVNVPSDRYQAHVALCERYLGPGANRDFQWRYAGLGKAEVRLPGCEIDVPERGSMVNFDIELCAFKKTKGRRTFLYGESVDSYIREKLGEHAGLGVADCEYRTVPVAIRRGDQLIHRPITAFAGTARVHDQKKLRTFLSQGFGDWKTFGFGMLNITEI